EIGPLGGDGPPGAGLARSHPGKGGLTTAAAEPDVHPPRADGSEPERATVEIQVEATDDEVADPDGFQPGGAEREVAHGEVARDVPGDTRRRPGLVVLRPHVDPTAQITDGRTGCKPQHAGEVEPGRREPQPNPASIGRGS